MRLERISDSAKLLMSLFQFHKGAIRTRIQKLSEDKVDHFNSIKVRLEPSNIGASSAKPPYFNSIKVRLEHSHILHFGWDNKFQFHKGAIRTTLEW